jgi:hypothetical protein
MIKSCVYGVAVDLPFRLGIFPDVIEPGKGKESPTLQLKIMPGKGRLGVMEFIRLIKACCWY